MALKLSPEFLVARFVKSATNGRKTSVKLSRILTIIVLPIWLGSIVIATDSYIQAFKAVPKYRTIQNFKKRGINLADNDTNCFGGHSHLSATRDRETTQCCFYSPFWKSVGVIAPDHRNSVYSMVAEAENTQLGEIEKFLHLPYLLLLFVVAPWVIIRIIYWIKDSDKGESENHLKSSKK